jgi:hypothetical protein
MTATREPRCPRMRSDELSIVTGARPVLVAVAWMH